MYGAGSSVGETRLAIGIPKVGAGPDPAPFIRKKKENELPTLTMTGAPTVPDLLDAARIAWQFRDIDTLHHILSEIWDRVRKYEEENESPANILHRYAGRNVRRHESGSVSPLPADSGGGKRDIPPWVTQEGY